MPAPDLFVDDLAVVPFLPVAALEGVLLAFVVDLDRAVVCPLLREFAAFEVLPLRADFDVDLDDPDLAEPVDRDDLVPEADAFERDEPDAEDLFDFAAVPEALDVRELPPDLDELPDLAELFVVEDFRDLVPVAFDPPDERPDVDLRAPVELFEPVDLLDEPDFELADFLVVDLDPEDFFVDDAFDPEDFFVDEDFDPEDFLVAAMTLDPRYIFRICFGQNSRSAVWPLVTIDHADLSSLYLRIRRTVKRGMISGNVFLVWASL